MPVLRRLLGGEHRRSRALPRLDARSTAADISVTPERAIQVASVYSCVRVLAENVGSLPVGMFERTAKYRERVADDPVLSLVADTPNPDIDAAELWRMVIGWMALRGNAYVFVERNGAGQPIGLWPIAPSSVQIKRGTNGRLVYEVTLADDEWAPLPKGGIVRAEHMLHYRAFGFGPEGLSPITVVRQQVGINFAATSYIGGFFARDASPGGVIQVDGTLSDDAFERLQEQWKALHEGFDKAHRLAILEGGAKWEKTTLSPADAAFLEVMKFGRQEIAGVFGVPPHLIGDVDRSTSWGTGIEEQTIGLNTYVLRHYTVRLERVTRRLLTNPARYFRWNLNALVSGDITKQYEAFAKGREWGWLSANDVLRKIDEDPIGEAGDVYVTPLNMIPAGAQPVQRSHRVTRLIRSADP